MSLSRSPSPRPNGSWSINGLIYPPRSPFDINGNTVGSDATRGYPSFSTRNEGFFSRSKRKISSTIPRFNRFNKDWRETEKLGRGRWSPRQGGVWARLKTFVGNFLRKFKFLFVFLAIFGLIAVVGVELRQLSNELVYSGTDTFPEVKTRYRRNAHLGGGSKFVIILGANHGGGVMDWKGPREWAIERDSVKNKKKYATRWGYHLEISDMSTKKRYAHEWREGWEKVDILRNCMGKYPNAEWFWWLDLNTFIMEPSVSLQSHIFNDLASNTYRDINFYNPLNITHPFPASQILDPTSLSPTGDNLTSGINLILSQDCSGFNLGSFFVRRSVFADRLLDIWWDPVAYEQTHMDWEHKEQDALEHLYTTQPWVRSGTAFIEQRKINSFPPGACAHVKADGRFVTDTRIHYHEKDRDFIVNMAGCEWGRNCWGEMYQYRELSSKLNRTWRERFQDATSAMWKGLMAKKEKKA